MAASSLYLDCLRAVAHAQSKPRGGALVRPLKELLHLRSQGAALSLAEGRKLCGLLKSVAPSLDVYRRALSLIIHATHIDPHASGDAGDVREFCRLAHHNLALLRKLYAANQLSLSVLREMNQSQRTRSLRLQWERAVNRVRCETGGLAIALNRDLPARTPTASDPYGQACEAVECGDLHLLRRLYQQVAYQPRSWATELTGQQRIDLGILMLRHGHYDVVCALGGLRPRREIATLIDGASVFARSPRDVVDATHWVWPYVLHARPDPLASTGPAERLRQRAILNAYVEANCWAGHFDHAHAFFMASVATYR